MKDFYRILKYLKANKHTIFALATIIEVKGSSYRRAGAKMLFKEDGEHFGTISAGCLEEDLAHHAKEVIKTKKSQIVTYNLFNEDDLSWGQGAGCNGVIEIFVEPLSWNPKLEQVEIMLDSGEKVGCAKVIPDQGKHRQLFFDENNMHTEFDEKDKHELLFQILLFKEQDLMISVIRDGLSNNELLLLEWYEPIDQLYIFGAGPDVEPLVEIAAKMDFSTTIIDPRSSRCNKKYFPSAHRLIVEFPESFIEREEIQKNSYVLVMTHNFIRDKRILHSLLKISTRYLGVLGSKKRSERLALPESLPEWVYSPVGLMIGAEGPEEISISIISQLIQVRRQYLSDPKRLNTFQASKR